ncbi:hypothetical protein BVRB_9g204920 [Beta vulgaris subsp. vulgaris]|nr:hypothetical protein BVRB_9g204920 [Beta vulgaris subsp. vulgaris]
MNDIDEPTPNKHAATNAIGQGGVSAEVQAPQQLRPEVIALEKVPSVQGVQQETLAVKDQGQIQKDTMGSQGLKGVSSGQGAQKVTSVSKEVEKGQGQAPMLSVGEKERCMVLSWGLRDTDELN